jgi:hypothetical protein
MKKRGKTGWELARKAKEPPPLLSLLAPVPQTSTGLPPIKLVGTGEEAVADMRAQRARDGGDELQPCRRSVQRERNGKLAIMERERERERERRRCLYLGEPWRRRLHVLVNRSTCGLVGWLWVGLSLLLAFSSFPFLFSIFFSGCMFSQMGMASPQLTL